MGRMSSVVDFNGIKAVEIVIGRVTPGCIVFGSAGMSLRNDFAKLSGHAMPCLVTH